MPAVKSVSSPLNGVPPSDQGVVPSEYAYSDGLVADTDGADGAASLPCFSTTAALRSRVQGISETYDETGEGPRMAWDEWEQLKTAAAERHSTRMQLNQLPGDQNGTSSSSSGASSRLRSDKKAWSMAGQGVGDLRDQIDKALAKLEHGTTELGKDSGCATAAAQKSVYDSWEHRMKDISELCNGLARVLEKVGNDQLKTDEAIKTEVAGLKVYSEDTSAAGGTGKGR